LVPAHPRILVCCGEPSGDLYGAELVREVRNSLPGLTTVGLGGDRLLDQGTTLLAHVRDLAVVGLLEVVRHLRSLRRVFARVLAEVDRARPDLAVLVDYPDFNLRLARELRRRGVPVLYYVSPQVWAWRRGRVRTIRETVSHMAVIFPFEAGFYREAGVPVTFVGHPLVDLVRPPADPAAALRDMGLDPARPVVALLPGSRPGEVGHNLPPLLGAVERLRSARPDLQFALALAPSLAPERVRERLGRAPVPLIEGRTHDLVGSAALALVASGTATVETAILGTPMVVVYRLSPLTYLLGRPLVRVAHYAMANLIAGRAVVPELIQRDFTPERVAREALDLLGGHPERTARMRADLAEVRARLGGPGASRRGADLACSMLEKS
jgi:lipid-A-disaccharide synthase